VETLDETLYARVDELISSHRSEELRLTTGPSFAISELAARSEGLEKAIREIALEVQRLAEERVE
jgi:metal-responsive CopG/Arc/MetJ family transcriptional regulator